MGIPHKIPVNEDEQSATASGPQTGRTDNMTQEKWDSAVALAAYPVGVTARGPFLRSYVPQLPSVLRRSAAAYLSRAHGCRPLPRTLALVWDVTHQARWLGIVSGAQRNPVCSFRHVGRPRSRYRYSRRAVLVWTQSFAMVLAFLLALLATNRPVHLQAWHIALFAALLGVVNAFNMPAQQAFVTDMVDERSAMSNAIALNSFRFNIARFAGPIFAGVVLTKYGAPTCFFINGLSYIAVVASLMMMRLATFTPIHRKINIMEGVVYIWHNHAVLRSYHARGELPSLFAWSVSTLFPMISAYFRRGEGGYSAIMAVQGIGAAAGSAMLAAFSDRLDRRTMVYGGAICFCLLLISLAFSANFHLALVLLGAAGFSMIVFGMSAQIRVQEEVPDELRGRVLAVYSLVFQGLMPVGGIEDGVFGAASQITPTPLAAQCRRADRHRC